MKRDATGRRLTPALYDFYVAQARAERAKAIAAFGGQLSSWLGRAARRLTAGWRRGHVAGSPTAR